MFCRNCGASLRDGAKFCPQCGTRCESAPAAGGAAGHPQPTVAPGVARAPSFSSNGQNADVKCVLAVACAIYLVLAFVWIVKTITETGDFADLIPIFDEDTADMYTMLFFIFGFCMIGLFISAGIAPVTKFRVLTNVEGLKKQDMGIALGAALCAGLFGLFLMVGQGVFDSWEYGDGGESYTWYTVFYVYGDLFKYCLIPLAVAIAMEAYAWARLLSASGGTQ